MKQGKDLRLSLISSCLAGVLLFATLLSWKQAFSLIPVGFMTLSSLVMLGVTRAYFHWKDRSSD